MIAIGLVQDAPLSCSTSVHYGYVYLVNKKESSAVQPAGGRPTLSEVAISFRSSYIFMLFTLRFVSVRTFYVARNLSKREIIDRAK